uniref:Uncharacterized protein n=1 Tax=Salarias fasciatus TaxID=181472 RepID=A0A672G892_SALFA
MASFKKSFESLKGSSHSAAKGVTDSAGMGQAVPVNDLAAQEASRQTQAAIGKAADKASDTIKEFGQKMETK